MIRKQLHHGDAQDQGLETRTQELGISEAELVRHTALARLLDNAKRLSREHRLPESYRFDRKALYDERESRWLKHR